MNIVKKAVTLVADDIAFDFIGLDFPSLLMFYNRGLSIFQDSIAKSMTEKRQRNFKNKFHLIIGLQKRRKIHISATEL